MAKRRYCLVLPANKRRYSCLILIVAMALLSSGCWDRIEIQDRGMVKAIAIDVADAEQSPVEQTIETYVQPHGAKQFRISFQVIRLATGGAGGKSSSQAKTFVLSNQGRSLFETLRETLGQFSKSLDLGHLDTVIISEAALREEGLRPLVDYLMRDPAIRWRTRLYVAPQRARPFLEFEPPTGEASGQYILNIANNQMYDARLPLVRTDLGYTVMVLDNGYDIFLPRIDLADKQLKVGNGAAVFHKDRFAGYIDDYAVMGLRFIRGYVKSACLTVSCDAHPEKLIALNISDCRTDVESRVDNGHIRFIIDIKVTGRIDEFQCIDEHGPIENTEAQKLEEHFAREIERNAYYGIEAIKQNRTDPTGSMAAHIHTRHPDTWKQVKDSWRDLFPSIPVEVHAKVTIRTLGEHR